jgi:hypothetical protein
MTPALLVAILRLLDAGPATAPVSFSVTHVEDAQPRIIHIYNLDDGPRSIVLSRLQSDDDPSRTIRILNELGEGVRELVLPRE